VLQIHPPQPNFREESRFQAARFLLIANDGSSSTPFSLWSQFHSRFVFANDRERIAKDCPF